MRCLAEERKKRPRFQSISEKREKEETGIRRKEEDDIEKNFEDTTASFAGRAVFYPNRQ